MENLSKFDDYNERFIKTEEEEARENDDLDAKLFLFAPNGLKMGETKTNLIDVKLESSTTQENGKLLNRSNFEECYNSIIKAEKTSNNIPGLDKIDSTIIKMEDYSNVVGDNHQIFIKTEVEAVDENNYEQDANSYVSPADKTDQNLIKVKLKFETKQEYENEELMSANKGNLEMEVETYNEGVRSDEFVERAEITTSDKFGTRTQQNSGCKKNLYKKCDECDFVSKYTCALKLHKKTKHSDERPFKCDKCDYTAKILTNLKKHKIKHTEIRPFKCDECSYQAKTRDLLKEHRLRHTELRPFKCNQCDYSAKNEKDLNRHQKKHKEMVTFHCDECEYTTKYKCNLTKHKVIHLDPCEVKIYKCDLCDYKSMNRGNFQQHQFKHKSIFEVKSYRCTKCDYVSKYKENLTSHLLTHLDPTIQCDQCDYKARTLGYFKQHQLIHKDISEVETFKCYLCDYIAKRKRDLKRHIVARHRKKMKI